MKLTPLAIFSFFITKILFKNKKIGHITNENTFMMCPTFLFMILGEMIFTKLV